MSLHNPYDEHWIASLPIVLGAVTITDVLAWVSSVNWASIFSMCALGVTAIGGAGIGLYRQLSLTQIEIQERRRKATELPVDQLKPEEIQAAESPQK